MGIKVACPECSEDLEVPADLAGQRAECPECGSAITLPEAPAEAAEPERKPKGVRRTCPECGAKIPVGKSRCAECGESYAVGKQRKRSEAEEGDGAFAPEKKALNKGMLGGIALMAIGAVWFVGGWLAGYIFFYPPILFAIGAFGFLKGLLTGNVAGKKTPAGRRRRR